MEWEDEVKQPLTIAELRKIEEEKHRQEMIIFWQRKAKERNEQALQMSLRPQMSTSQRLHLYPRATALDKVHKLV